MFSRLQRAALVSFFLGMSGVVGTAPALAAPKHHHLATRHGVHHRIHKLASHHRVRREQIPGQPDTYQSPLTAIESFGSSLVADARKYLGTNPTNRRTLWCGAFMDKILRDTGHKGGGNLATGYLHYGRRISGPRVGAIAVMYRKGGGHVGVVSGVDANGNPVIISGNFRNTVAEHVYPRQRIAAYVVPGN